MSALRVIGEMNALRERMAEMSQTDWRQTLLRVR